MHSSIACEKPFRAYIFYPIGLPSAVVSTRSGRVATPLVEKRKTRSDDDESIVLLGTARAMTSGRRVEEGTTRRNVKQGERRI